MSVLGYPLLIAILSLVENTILSSREFVRVWLVGGNNKFPIFAAKMLKWLLLLLAVLAKNYILSPKSETESLQMMESLIQTIQSHGGKILKQFDFIDSIVVSLPDNFDFKLISSSVNIEQDREMTILKVE